MKDLSTARALFGVIAMALGLVFVLACGGEAEEISDLHPSELLGTWEEPEQKGRLIFSADGTYQFIDASLGPPGFVEGQGTWEARGSGLSVELTSGESTNFGFVSRAPANLRWSYSVSDATLELIELLGLRRTATYTRIGN